jgi:peptide/nickel transport system substrate-binding protein
MALPLATLASFPAQAGKKDDTLNIGWSYVLPSYDVYFNQSVAEGQMIGRLVWDHLIERDFATGEYGGILATAWRWVDPVTLEFDLREGVKFHDGSSFSADDVVFTVNWVVDKANNVNIRNMVDWMKSAEKVGPNKVRINLHKPFPAALEYVAGTLAIYPKDYYAKVGPKGMSDKPIGSGPYKVVEAVAGKNITLVKNENYFKGGAKGQPAIGKIVQRTIGETQTQVAELLSGRLDWIWSVPPDLAKNLASRPNIKVVQAESMRISYMTLDAEGKASPPLGNLKVRQAFNHAINREALVKYIFPGTRLISANCHPVQFGCPADVVKYEYDPEKAKKLLAEAGYPNGFDIDIYAYRDRQVTEAVIADLRKVGVNAKLVYMTFPAMYEKKLAKQTPLVHSTTGSWSIADVGVPLSVTFQGGPPDMAGDAELTAWINEAANLIDQDRRKALYRIAYQRITERAYMVPLTTDLVTYAMRRGNCRPAACASALPSSRAVPAPARCCGSWRCWAFPTGSAACWGSAARSPGHGTCRAASWSGRTAPRHAPRRSRCRCRPDPRRRC